MKAYVYTIWNLKGGVGKTTTAVNLAYNFSVLGKRVLVMELDPQVNLTPFFTKANEYQKNILTLMNRPEQIKSSIYRTKYKNIDIIKGHTGLLDSRCREGIIGSIISRIQILRSYDIILIDCRTSCEAFTHEALSASDAVLTPVILDGYCRDNLRQVSTVIESLDNERVQWFVFANKVKTTRAQRKILGDLLERHAYPFLDACAVERAAAESALELKKPLMKHAPQNSVSQDFMNLAEELLKKQEEGMS